MSSSSEKQQNEESTPPKPQATYVKTYTSDSRLYSLSLQANKTDLALACSTMNVPSSPEKPKNFIEVSKLSDEASNFQKTSSIECEYPVSKVMFSPSEQNSNLLITTSDCLRLYNYSNTEGKISLEATLLSKSKTYCGPLTSCDWSRVNSAIVGVSSIDTTCAIWDINKLETKKLIITLDKEVYDISMGPDEYTFMVTGADGSVRMIDTRTTDASNIIFETGDKKPLICLDWNKVNTNFVIAVGLDKKNIYILDKRNPDSIYSILKEHSGVVNKAVWCPGSSSVLCSVGEDKNAFMWNINQDSHLPEKPILGYTANGEIENVSWGYYMDEWVGITYGNTAEILKIK